MNRAQRAVLVMGGLVIALSCIYPPWRQLFQSASLSRAEPAGYAPIYSPPDSKSSAWSVAIDSERWAIQCISILVTCGVLLLVFAKSPKVSEWKTGARGVGGSASDAESPAEGIVMEIDAHVEAPAGSDEKKAASCAPTRESTHYMRSGGVGTALLLIGALAMQENFQEAVLPTRVLSDREAYAAYSGVAGALQGCGAAVLCYSIGASLASGMGVRSSQAIIAIGSFCAGIGVYVVQVVL